MIRFAHNVAFSLILMGCDHFEPVLSIYFLSIVKNSKAYLY